MRFRFKDLIYISIVTVLAVKLFAVSSEDTIEFEAIGDRYQVEGQFGVPVGYGVTLEVKKIDNLKKGLNFLVETIDGRAASREIMIDVEGTGHWPIGATATIVGSETGM